MATDTVAYYEAQILVILAQIEAMGPKPDYSLKSLSVQWDKKMQSLTKLIDWYREQITKLTDASELPTDIEVEFI